jgi:hypothetical protein
MSCISRLFTSRPGLVKGGLFLRLLAYLGCNGEEYLEAYSAVQID